ncbi:hypothetical protein ACYZUD_03660 [Pseudomonas sp. XS1P51]
MFMVAGAIVVPRFIAVQKCQQQGKEKFPLSAENTRKDNISLLSDIGRLLPVEKGRKRPIVLKKSVMVSSAEKYASEIEIFTFGRGFRTRISHSSVQKRRFH